MAKHSEKPMYNFLVWTLTKQAREALQSGDIEDALYNISLAQMEALTIPGISDEQKADVYALRAEIKAAVDAENAQVVI